MLSEEQIEKAALIAKYALATKRNANAMAGMPITIIQQHFREFADELAALTSMEPVKVREMEPVPAEMSFEFMKSINFENQVLAYERGSYFNAWLVFDEYEGGWRWMNESDNEPSPTHYCRLPAVRSALEGA